MTFDLGTIAGKVDLDLSEFDRKYARLEDLLDKLERVKIPDVEVGVDTTRGETAVDAFVGGVLGGMKDASVDVGVDTAKAEKGIAAVETAVRTLDGRDAEVEVTADTSRVESALEDVGDTAAEEGSKSGDRMGEGMVAGILAGLASIPIAGAIVQIGQSIGNGLIEGVKDGFSQEVSRDLFSARTGLDDVTARRFAAAAGESYANAFGESVEDNLDRARQAMQLGLIDPSATQADIERVLAQIDTLVTVSEEDAGRISQAVDVMLSAGVVRSADEAFDVLTAGFQNGVNSAEDLLDTFIEYPALLDRLGLDAETALGLMNQGLEAGARNSDLVADALKEFQIRATDASEGSAAGFEAIGLNAEKMTAQIAEGGPKARDGLDMVLDRLRKMEDPVARNVAGVALFGTQWEDLGDAILALDVSTAVDSLGEVEGALDRAMSKLADNPATVIEGAKRQIEIAGDGVKVALAEAFGPMLEDFAEWASGDRAGVVRSLGGWTNAMFDFARAGVEGAASLVEAFGSFVATSGPQVIGMVIDIVDAIDNVPGIEVDDGVTDQLHAIASEMKGFGFESQEAGDAIRRNLIDNGIDPVQDRFNEGLDTAVLLAQVHDTSTALVSSIGAIGSSLEDLDHVELDLDGRFDTATRAGADLDAQLRDAVSSIGDVQGAAALAGESQDSLTQRWREGRDALVAQIESLGYTREEAVALAEAYGAVPTQIETSVDLDTAPARVKLGDLVVEVDSASGTVTVNGDKTPADATLGELVGDIDTSDGTVTIHGNKLPADLTLEQLLGVIGGSRETVTINGRDYPAQAVLGDLLRYISRSGANVSVGANTSGAYASVDQLLRTYNGRTMTVYTMVRTIGQAPVATGGDVDAHAAAALGATRLAGGGAVRGPGTGTSDEVPAAHPSGVAFWLSNGEHVLTADDVLDLGGQEGAYALRAMIQAGMIRPLEDSRRLAGGGPVDGPVGSAPVSVGLPGGEVRLSGELRLSGDGRAFVVGTLERNLRDVATLTAAADNAYRDRMVTP